MRAMGNSNKQPPQNSNVENLTSSRKNHDAWRIAFTPDKDPITRNSLVEVYQALKHSYRNYDTRVAMRRMQAFRRTLQELRAKGFPIALELLGSINFGLVEPSSDADCIILHYCDQHMHDGECGLQCPNLIFEKSEILRILATHNQADPFQLEILDCINLKYIDQKIKSGDVINDILIMRFMFYRILGRPVNRPLFVDLYDTLEENEDLMNQFSKWASEALAEYLKTSDHRHSFSKYNERIISSHLHLPDELKAELQNYLK